MNDTIFNARDVTKNSTYRVEAFQSRDMGPLGFADADGKIIYYHQPTRKHTAGTEFDVRAMTHRCRASTSCSPTSEPMAR